MQRYLSLLVALATLCAAAFAPAAVNAQEAAVADIRVLPEYRLGSGDKVRVITYGEESLTGEFFVGGSGNISLPLIG